MKLLVMGGTRFVGRYIVSELLAGDYDVTLFNRGITHPDLFPKVNRIRGDRRTSDIEKLRDSGPDVVIDVSAYYPEDVEEVIQTIGQRIKRYIFCSSTDVYDDTAGHPVREGDPVKTYNPIPRGTWPMRESYGGNKAECERRIAEAAGRLGFEYVILRPCIVYGPHEHSGRVRYWLHRAKEGQIVIPGEGMNVPHLVYAEDLAKVFVTAVDSKIAANKRYNVAADRAYSLNEIVERISAAVGGAKIEHVPLHELERLGKKPEDFPLWNSRHVIADSSLARRELGFRSTPFEEGLRQMLASLD